MLCDNEGREIIRHVEIKGELRSLEEEDFLTGVFAISLLMDYYDRVFPSEAESIPETLRGLNELNWKYVSKCCMKA